MSILTTAMLLLSPCSFGTPMFKPKCKLNFQTFKLALNDLKGKKLEKAKKHLSSCEECQDYYRALKESTRECEHCKKVKRHIRRLHTEGFNAMEIALFLNIMAVSNHANVPWTYQDIEQVLERAN